MPKPSTTTAAPQIDRLVLPGLIAAEPSALVAGADLEATHVVGPPGAPGALSLKAARLWGCHLEALSADETDLRASRLVETRLEAASLPVVRAARCDWRDVQLSGRLGSVEAYEAQWRSVRISEAKIDFLNLRGADLVDVAFDGCRIGELDLAGATLRRVSFDASRIDQVDLQDSQLHDVDLRGADLGQVDGVTHLRGATLSSLQLASVAELIAAELGIRVDR